MNKTKHIFVTGGVASSLGKGIIAASLAKLLIARGFRVAIQKLDPYINIDPGTLNPYEHGECFVTEDGAETDLDLGHYERFTDHHTSQANNVTSGKIYLSVIEKERRGDFLGETVQVIPHITDEIKNRIQLLEQNNDNLDIVITEIGGTVGDIESLPFVEAMRQMKWELGNNCIVVHLTYVPFLAAAGELKTKPTQHSVKTMLEQGVQPDIIVCRTEKEINQSIRQKIALFCNVDKNCVMQSIDAKSIYEVPLLMRQEQLDVQVLKKLNLPIDGCSKLDDWEKFLNNFNHPEKEVTIALIGKYIELKDAYKSIFESFIHAGAIQRCKVNIKLIAAETVENNDIKELLENVNAVLVAPGFGQRGIEGKIKTIQYVRENNIPFLGICLGMQCCVIEFARNVLGHKDANSVEIDPATSYPAVCLMEEQKKIENLGGTMRLGAYPCSIKKDSLAEKIYGTTDISERHRHRFEFNNMYISEFEKAGMSFSGTNPNIGLVEIVELPSHPFFIGVQFHPEYKSTVNHPHPLFVAFVKAAVDNTK